MENATSLESAAGSPADFLHILNSTQEWPFNGTGVPEKASLSDHIVTTLLRVTGDPMSGLRATEAAVAAGLLAAQVAPSQTPPAPAHLVVAFWDSPLSHGINVFVGIILCFTMLGLGCTVEVSQIGEHIRRPIGVLLALVCQFVIMPLVAFLLALAFSLNDVEAIAVLLCGCCPGGNLSNIMSLLVNGEMNLR